MELELLVLEGPHKGRRFAVTAAGLRLGRSASCEIAVPGDPALSRNHCLFEMRDGAVWVTDLASANGTLVNEALLETNSRELKAGDRIAAGDTVLAAVEPGGAAPAQSVDLGFAPPTTVEPPAEEGAGLPLRRLLLWIAAALAVAGSGALILAGGGDAAEPAVQEISVERPRLRAFDFERVDAAASGVYRTSLALDGKGMLTVTIDDVPNENRHVEKSQKLSPEALDRLAKILLADDLRKLDREYAGPAAESNSLQSRRLRVVGGTDVVSVLVENAQEPEPFRRAREQLETFAKNELGLWAIQYSAEKLVEMSAESRRVGDSKWRERDAQNGNLAAALAAYDEAIVYLETVNPKPQGFDELVKRRREVAADLEKRHADQRFLVDRAIKLQNWALARRELLVLCELVPDAKDPRHAEAAAKLLDVEARVKKGGAK